MGAAMSVLSHGVADAAMISKISKITKAKELGVPTFVRMSDPMQVTTLTRRFQSKLIGGVDFLPAADDFPVVVYVYSPHDETEEIREIECVKRTAATVSPALAHALRAFVRLGDQGIDGVARSRLLMTLRRATTAATIYPSITSDGFGAAIAEWRAGNRMIAIEFTPDGEYSWIATNDEGSLERNEVGIGEPDPAELAESLEQFSDHVAVLNSSWRQLFD